MKAAMLRAFGPVETLEIVDIPEKRPQPDEVIIDVEASEVNFADILVIEGRYQVKPPLPFSPGKAAAGIVTAVGSSISDIRPGDRVAAHVEYGAYVRQLCVKRGACFPLPVGVEFDAAAALGLAYQTSYFALTDRARIKPGDSVLVLGANGGTGMAAIQLAKAFGADVVIAGSRNGASAPFGADHVVDVAGGDVRDTLRKQVTQFTGGKGVDIVIDPVGGAIGDAALRCLAWRGRFVVVGFASGEMPSLKAGYILVKNIEVTGLQWSDYRDRMPDEVATAQRKIFKFYEAGKLKPHIAKHVSFAELSGALNLLRDGKGLGRYVLQPGG